MYTQIQTARSAQMREPERKAIGMENLVKRLAKASTHAYNRTVAYNTHPAYETHVEKLKSINERLEELLSEINHLYISAES